MSAPPIPCMWDGRAFVPLPRFHNVAAGHYGEGEVVTLAEHGDRSMRSHGHYFALLHDLWLTLPERIGLRFANETMFRKHALIETGWRDERTIACSSKAEAERIAAFIRPMDEYAIVIVRDAVVIVYTAKSQSLKAMGKADFQQSKDDVISWAADLIGVAPESLSKRQGPGERQQRSPVAA